MASATRVPRRLYLDTSAYLCMLLGEDGAADLSAETHAAELMTSVLLLLEVRRNLIRLARDGTLTDGQYEACLNRMATDEALLVVRDLTPDLSGTHPIPAVTTPRSLDLAHLRTALWFHSAQPIDRFVTLDAQQAQAARELGLPV